MTEAQIRSSILQYLSEQYAGAIDAGGADNFDPTSQDVSEWILAFVDIFEDKHKRRGGKWHPPLRLVVHCYYRAQDNIYGASELASGIAATFRSAESVPVKDYDSSGEPAVGYVSFNDPQTTDETENMGIDGWQVMMAVIEGRASEL